MNDLWDDTKPGGHIKNVILRQAKEALDHDVFKAAGDDIFKASRQANTEMHNSLKTAGVSKFDTRSTNIVRDVIENKINPDRYVEDLIISRKYRSSDLKQLVNYVGDESPEAIKSMQADTMAWIKNEAFKGPIGENETQAITRAGFDRAVKKIGAKKLDVLLDEPQKQFIKRLGRVLALLEPISGTQQGYGPSAQAVFKAVGGLQQATGNLASILKGIWGEIKLSNSGKLMLSPIDTKAIKGFTPSPESTRKAARVGAALTSSELSEQQRNR